MRTRLTTKRGEEGSAILITMLLTFVISIMVAGAILMVEHEHKFSVVSSNRAQSLHTAEAGIDFVIATLQQMVQYGYDWEGNGWDKDGNVLSMNDIALSPVGHTAPDSSFSVSVNTNTLITIASGSMAEPGTGGTITRRVQVELEPDWMYRFEKGMLGRDNLNFQGNPICDSYNSNDGPYGGLNVSTNCDIGSMSLTTDGIDGGGSPVVDGDVYVTEVGDAVGEFWTGQEFDSLDVDIPPYIPKLTHMTAAAMTGGEVINVAGNTYVGVPSIEPTGGSKFITIQGEGTVTIYVDGEVDFGTASDLNIIPDPGKELKVIIVCNGDYLNLKGTLNFTGPAENLQIYGTESCTRMEIEANNDSWYCVYAPNADVKLSGNADVYGSLVGKTLDVGGNFGFHYDEALATNSAPVLAGFVIKSWKEL